MCVWDCKLKVCIFICMSVGMSICLSHSLSLSLYIYIYRISRFGQIFSFGCWAERRQMFALIGEGTTP